MNSAEELKTLSLKEIDHRVEIGVLGDMHRFQIRPVSFAYHEISIVCCAQLLRQETGEGAL